MVLVGIHEDVAQCVRAVQCREQPVAAGSLALRLPFWAPLCPHNLFGHLAATAVPEVVEWRDGVYRRTLRLPHGHGVVALRPQPEYIDGRPTLNDLRDLSTAITRCRWLLGLELRRGGEGAESVGLPTSEGRGGGAAPVFGPSQ